MGHVLVVYQQSVLFWREAAAFYFLMELGYWHFFGNLTDFFQVFLVNLMGDCSIFKRFGNRYELWELFKVRLNHHGAILGSCWLLILRQVSSNLKSFAQRHVRFCRSLCPKVGTRLIKGLNATSKIVDGVISYVFFRNCYFIFVN